MIKENMKVKLSRNLICGETYGRYTFVHKMRPFIGKWVTVKHFVKENSFTIIEEENNTRPFVYTKEMTNIIGKFTYGK